MKKIISINILIIIFLLIFLEFFCRYILDFNVQGISSNLINQNKSILFNNKNLKNAKAFGVKIYTDENGFRIQKDLKRKNAKKILFIGGSVTFGPGILAENTFVGKLNKINKKSVENASVIGSNLENNYKLYKKFTENDKVEKIFISLGFDDLNNDQVFNLPEKDIDKKLKNISIIKNFNKYLRAKSASYVYFKTFLADAKKNYYINELTKYKNLKSINEAKLIFNKFMPKKEKIFFYIIPYAEQVNMKSCKEKDIGETFFEKVLNERQFNFLSLKKEFCKYKNPEKLYLVNDPAHLSKIGHDLTFNVLKEYVDQKSK
jgi:hypothetical protein